MATLDTTITITINIHAELMKYPSKRRTEATSYSYCTGTTENWSTRMKLYGALPEQRMSS